MTAVSKNMYIDKLNDIGNKYNNTYHRIVKMKLEDIKVNVYIEFNKEVHNKDPKNTKIFCILIYSKLVGRSFCD